MKWLLLFPFICTFYLISVSLPMKSLTPEQPTELSRNTFPQESNQIHSLSWKSDSNHPTLISGPLFWFNPVFYQGGIDTWMGLVQQGFICHTNGQLLTEIEAKSVLSTFVGSKWPFIRQSEVDGAYFKELKVIDED